MPDASRAALGLRARKGGAVAVGVAVEDGEPRVLLSVSLETSAEGDRLSFEPYRVAGGDRRAVEDARRDGWKTLAQGAEAGLSGCVDRGCDQALMAECCGFAEKDSDPASISVVRR
jgi:hypothetical protein